MKNILKLLLSAFLLVISNLIFGVWKPSFFVFINALIVIPVSVYLIVSTNYSRIIRGVLAALPVILEDFIARRTVIGNDNNNLYNEGIFFLTIFELVAVVISLILLLIFLLKKDKEGLFQILRSMLSFILIILLYFSCFHDYGSVKKQFSKSVEDSKKRKAFIAEYELSENVIGLRGDTFFLKEAWAEKELQTDHRKIFRKTYPTGKYALVVKYRYHIEDWGWSNKFQYYMDEDSAKKSTIYYRWDKIVYTPDTLSDEHVLTIQRLKKSAQNIRFTKISACNE